jgi:hypothetical protein
MIGGPQTGDIKESYPITKNIKAVTVKQAGPHDPNKLQEMSGFIFEFDDGTT